MTIKINLKICIKKKNDEIDELLPGATSAGLAEAYKDEREVAQTNIKTWNIILECLYSFLLLFLVFIFAFHLRKILHI